MLCVCVQCPVCSFYFSLTQVIVPPVNLDELATVDLGGSACTPEAKIVLQFDILGEEAQAQYLNFSFLVGELV